VTSAMPYNGPARNLRGPLKRFPGGYAGRRQTARAARILDPKGTQSAGGELRDRTANAASGSRACYAACSGTALSRRN
jgi:hypothetical protein